MIQFHKFFFSKIPEIVLKRETTYATLASKGQMF